MPLVIIQTLPLSAEQKKRIGDRVVESLHGEGVPASSVVVLFQPDKSDVYLDGGLVHEVHTEAPAPRPFSYDPSPREIPPAQIIGNDFKQKNRRNRQELSDLRKQLTSALEAQGGLSSFQAQEALGLKECDWAPATLRRLFGELEAEGLIVKQGQKRGTRYVWKGRVTIPLVAPAARLVKRDAEEGSSDSDAPVSE